MDASLGGPDDGSRDRPAGLIGAVDNVLRLLRLFEDHEMLRVNQVARDMGLSRSTVHRMLATLNHHRFVEQDGFSRGYKPGPALVDIGLAVVQKMDIRTVGHSVLQRLRDEIDETVHLAILRGSDVLYIDGVESSQVIRAGIRIGWTFPAHATAAGKVLLAELPDDELDGLYPTGRLTAPTDRAVTTIAALRAQLVDVRRSGFGVNNAESETDVCAVAAAVRDRAGRVRAAISTTAPQSRVDERWITTVATATVRAADGLSGQISW